MIEVLPASGINLGPFEYFDGQHPFVDVSRQRGYAPYSAGSLNNGTITRNAYGEVTALGSNTTARKRLCLSNGNTHPLGLAQLLFDGQGDIRIAPGVSATYSLEHSEAGFQLWDIQGYGTLGIEIEILETDSGDPIRNVRLNLPFPGIDTENEVTATFNPAWVSTLAGYDCYRAMDWNSTNNSGIQLWSERTTLDHVDWSSARITNGDGSVNGGIPYERQIDLANELGKPLWITVHHLADNDYVQNLAALIDGRLDPALSIIIEYSNEVWNTSFKQWAYANSVLKPQYSVSTSHRAYGCRASEVISIVRNSVSTHDPLAQVIGVIAGQSASPTVLSEALTGSSYVGSQQADVAVIAPYFTTVNPTALYNSYLNDTYDPDDLFTELEGVIADSAIGSQTIANRSVAEDFGVPLGAYEGGQHLVPVGSTQREDSGYVELLKDFNRSALMGTLYEQYLTQWYGAGGKTMVLYTDCTPYNKNGFFGLMESYTDTSAAKYVAVQNFLSEFPDTLDVSEESDVAIVPHTLTAKGSTNGTSVTTDAVDTSAVTGPIFVWVGLNQATLATPTDNKSNTYTACTAIVNSTRRGQWFYCANPNVGTGHTWSLTGTMAAVAVLWLEGATKVNPVDSESAGAGASNSVQPGALNPSIDNCALLTGCVLTGTPIGTAPTIGGSFSTPFGSVGSGGVRVCNHISTKVQTTHQSENPTWTLSTASMVSQMLAAKPAVPSVITSSATASVLEGAISVQTLTGTGAGTLSWAIIGGEDQAKFEIVDTNKLQFKAAKDFENPDDFDANGSYIVQVRLTGSDGTDTKTITVTLTDDVSDNPSGGAAHKFFFFRG